MNRILTTFVFILALCFGGQAHAAIAFDAATGVTGSPCAVATTCSTNITIAGANEILIVGTSSGNTVSGVTYNGTAMTLVGSCSGSGNPVAAHGSMVIIYMFALVNPATGTHAIVSTAASATNIEVYGSAYSGVGQISIPEACASTITGTGGTSITGTVTTLTANAWAVAVGGQVGTAISAGAGTTMRAGDNFLGANSNLTGIFDSNGPIVSAGPTSLIINDSNTAFPMSIIIASLQPPTSAVSPGVLTLTSVSKTQAVMALSAQSGGTGPYTCQWYRSTTGGFTPGAGNIISGATSCSARTDTPGTVGPWFYLVVVTDSVSATATSNQLGAALNTGTNFSLCGIGDSIFSGYMNNGGSPTTLGVDPVTYAATMLAGMTKTRSALPVSNSAYAGTKTTDWLPSGATTGCGGSACLAPALAACAALTPAATVIVGQLGANDAVAGTTAATIYANIQTITAYLVTQGYTKVIWFQSAYGYPGGGSGVFTNATTGIQSQLNGLLPGLDNGTTILWANGNGGNIWQWSINNYLSGTLYNGDNLHPTALGDQQIGANIACAITNAVDANSCSQTGGGGVLVGGY